MKYGEYFIVSNLFNIHMGCTFSYNQVDSAFLLGVRVHFDGFI